MRVRRQILAASHVGLSLAVLVMASGCARPQAAVPASFYRDSEGIFVPISGAGRIDPAHAEQETSMVPTSQGVSAVQAADGVALPCWRAVAHADGPAIDREISRFFRRGPTSEPEEKSLEDINLARWIRTIEGSGQSRGREAVPGAEEGRHSLLIPWFLEALVRPEVVSVDIERSDVIAELGGLGSRNLLPELMRLGDTDDMTDRSRVSVAMAVFGPVAADRQARLDWADWWRKHKDSYWAADFRDWSEPDPDCKWEAAILALGLLRRPFEPEVVYETRGSEYVYLGGLGKMARYRVADRKIEFFRAVPWAVAFEAGMEAATHAVVHSVHEIEDKIWCRFGPQRGLAVLGSNLVLKRYWRTDREAIEAEYGELIRLGRRLPLWPVDDQGRVWDYVVALGAVRTYDGHKWQSLDLRSAATRTPELLRRLGCSERGIAAYEREYVRVNWVKQAADGAIYVGTDEGLLACQNRQWRHLNALDSPPLGYSFMECEGEGQPGDLWVSCHDFGRADALLRVRRGGEDFQTFAGWPKGSGGPGGVAGDGNGRTLFLFGLTTTNGGPAVWSEEGWRFYPALPWGESSPRKWLFDPDKRAWFCNDALVGYLEGNKCRTMPIPQEEVVGMAIGARGTILLVTKKGIWCLEVDQWGPRVSW